MAVDVMIDLETMATDAHAVIVSVGLVKFDNKTFDIVGTLYRALDRDEQTKIHRHISPTTMGWWMRQDEDARAVFKEATGDIFWDLGDIDTFMQDARGVWGNGADFDNMILGSLFEDFRLEKPWSYSQNRCFRTMKNEFPVTPPERVGTHHHALDDALHQVEWLKRIKESFTKDA